MMLFFFQHILFITAVVWSTTNCEPPVNSYLPPTSRNSGRPSAQYGPPGTNERTSFNQPEQGRNRNQPEDSYFPPGQGGPSNTLDTQYGPPRGQGLQQGSRGFSQSESRSLSQGGPQRNNAPNTQYGVPEQRNGPERRPAQSPFSESNNRRPTAGSANNDFNGPSNNRDNSFGPRGSEFSPRPESSYGPPPSGNYMSPNNEKQLTRGPQTGDVSSYSVPNEEPDSFSGKQSLRGPPSSSYGTPNFGSNTGGRGSGNQRGSNFGNDESDEPAKYEFNYEVDDAQTGTKFGHSEQRDGDTATGEYNVELPDGRKQIVEYEAGLQGYKPQIRYEGGGSSSSLRSGSGNRASQPDDQGYQRGGPGSSYPENDNSGFSQETQQSGRPGKYQQASQGGLGLTDQDFMGYSRTRPGDNGLGDFPGSGQKRFENEPEYATGNNNRLETLNGGPQNEGYKSDDGRGSGRDTGYPKGGPESTNEGYPRGRPENGASRSRNGPQSSNRNYPQSNNNGNNQRGGNGYPTGGPQGQVGGEEGYPSGTPNGPRGSGY
ncbi:pro-resilin-like [Achroia grisella]|uniref:pro-resilin-like n=1 Tax=Achroia grisella TaxID=688607 RepID=UPI0027D2573C|nr:pro-resilin-like [Achroia grisella]